MWLRNTLSVASRQPLRRMTLSTFPGSNDPEKYLASFSFAITCSSAKPLEGAASDSSEGEWRIFHKGLRGEEVRLKIVLDPNFFQRIHKMSYCDLYVGTLFYFPTRLQASWKLKKKIVGTSKIRIAWHLQSSRMAINVKNIICTYGNYKVLRS